MTKPLYLALILELGTFSARMLALQEGVSNQTIIQWEDGLDAHRRAHKYSYTSSRVTLARSIH